MRNVHLCFIALMVLVSASVATGAPASPAPTSTACPNGTCTLFFPLVINNLAPHLLAPDNGAQLATLAPPLGWQPSIPGLHKIEVSTDPTFSPDVALAAHSTKQVKEPLPDQIATLISSNLKPSTTYYWRVGAVQPQGTFYATTRSFTTPASGTIVLPGLAQLISPANNAKLKGTQVLLKWQPYSGAVIYRIKVYDANGVELPDSAQIAATKTSLLVEGLQPGTYTWKIKIYNEAGWGEYTTPWAFTIS